jgi:hypothetical protein
MIKNEQLSFEDELDIPPTDSLKPEKLGHDKKNTSTNQPPHPYKLLGPNTNFYNSNDIHQPIKRTAKKSSNKWDILKLFQDEIPPKTE